MAASAPPDGLQLVDPRGWVPTLAKGGPMLLAELSSRWSLIRGGRHLSPDSRKPLANALFMGYEAFI